jgi:formylglycine-generating enzyme required for sulfatase activity
MITNTNFETHTIRIETLDGHPQGTGFILTPSLAVTCAHVVQACGAGLGDRVRLSFQAGGEPMEAEVLADGYHQDADIAFLRLSASLPSGVTPAILSIARDGARIRAFGYPDVGEVNGLFGTGELVGTVTETDRPLLQLSSTQITAGFSGGPVWEEATGRIIGMVTSVAVPDDLARLDDVAFAIPAKTLRDLCPEELELQPVTVTKRDDDLRDKELAYLDGLLKRYEYWIDHYTPLAGIAEVRAAVKDGPRLDLPMPFIPPGFEKLIEHGYGERAKIRREPVDDLRTAVAEHRRIILLGDPGSGKTTTLWRLAYDYALEAKADAQAPLPLLVPLRGYTDDGPFDAYLARHLGALAPHLATYRASGRLILLLDGLNEMPQANYANRVDRIRDVLDRYPDEAVVVTCRALDYVEKLEQLQKVEVSPLDETRIRDFLHNYLGETAGERLFWAMTGGDDMCDLWSTWQRAGETWEAFWTAKEMPMNVRAKTRWAQYRLWTSLRKEPPLLALGRNPYLLLMTAEVYASARGELPANRARLFAAFVDTLLGREKKRHSRKWIAVERQKEGLATLAYAMQAERERGTTVERGWAAAHLRKAVPDCDVERLLYLATSATLLDADDSTVRFYHQLLQEYFAAREMGRRVTAGESLERYWPPDHWWEPSGWEETAILLAGIEPDASTLLERLAAVNPVLAARCLLKGGAQAGEMARHNTVLVLAGSLGDGRVTPTVRVLAGQLLARLGDPRPGVGVDPATGLPDIMWCEVPAGPFVMGSGDDDKPDYDNEKPQHRNESIAEDYLISRYPITNAQFVTFVEAGGYQERRYWTEAGWEWNEQEGRIEADDYGEPFNLTNHPVVGVSWYEAVAFCRWLTKQLRQDGELGVHQEIVLPTESQWEKAARGTDGRIYPWGNDLDPNRANYYDTRIGTTSAAGCFPGGASPYGVEDLSGNMWEWCRTKWEDDYKNYQDDNDLEGDDFRMLRGGSFNFEQWIARCVYRSGRLPHNRNRLIGFRVCVVSQ